MYDKIPDEDLQEVVKKFSEKLPAEVYSVLELCAIVHWFDVKILEQLFRNSFSVKNVKLYYDEISKFPFIKKHPFGGQCLHEAIQRSIRMKIWNESHQKFTDLSSNVVNLCTKYSEIARQQKNIKMQRFWNVEKAYHSILASKNGSQLAHIIFMGFAGTGDIGSCRTMLSVITEHETEGRLNLGEDPYVKFWRGYIYEETANFVEAINYYRDGLTILQEGEQEKNKDQLAAELNLRLGENLWGCGMRAAAKEHYRASLTVLNIASDRLSRAYILSRLGEFAQLQSNYEYAEKCFKEILTLNPEHGFSKKIKIAALHETAPQQVDFACRVAVVFGNGKQGVDITKSLGSSDAHAGALILEQRLQRGGIGAATNEMAHGTPVSNGGVFMLEQRRELFDALRTVRGELGSIEDVVEGPVFERIGRRAAFRHGEPLCLRDEAEVTRL